MGSSLLFLAHQLLQKGFKIYLPLADAYLDPLLAMPLILPFLEYERAFLFKKKANNPLTTLEVIVTTFYVSMNSEVAFPRLSTQFTYDVWDFVCYFIGAGIYLLVHRQKAPLQARA